MKSYVQFLTTPTADTPGTCLVLHFDSKRYLIGNAHEGTQRSFIQRGVAMKKISDIFLTGKMEWKNTGGVLGIILTLADITKTTSMDVARVAQEKSDRKDRYLKANGIEPEHASNPAKLEQKQSLMIHGGENLMHTIATARRFVFRKGMPVHVNEIEYGTRGSGLEPTWKDENIMVWAMPILPESATLRAESSLPKSPGKRTFDEFKDEGILGAQGSVASCAATLTEEKKNQMLRKGVVADMFDSDWKLDALIETPLKDVQMPAKIFIRDTKTKKLEQWTGPKPGGKEPLPEINVLVRRPWPGALVSQLPPTKPSLTSMCYVIKNYPQRGKFEKDKAIALGVKPGPDFRLLTLGLNVTTKDGKIVRPEQVLAPGKIGGGFAFVELPSIDYLADLMSRPEWKNNEVMEGVGAIIWNVHPSVVQEQLFQECIQSFSNLKHVLSSPGYTPNYLSLDSAAAAAIRLNQIDSQRFPVPVHNNAPALLPESLRSCTIANRGLQVILEPEFGVDENQIAPPLNTALWLQQAPKDVLMLAKAINQQIATKATQAEIENQDLPSPEAEIITLGTGSALPSKYRNVSATLVRVPRSGSYLMDCGENTLGQLSRIYTQVELKEVLSDLKMIWISHLHADHHLGTTSVIKAWYEAVYGGQSGSPLTSDPIKTLSSEQRLLIASDGAMLSWLTEYSSVEDFGYDKLVLLNVRAAKPGYPNSTTMDWNGLPIGFDTSNPALDTALRQASGLTNLQAVNVPHCWGAKGVSLTFPSGFKLTYSGDCRPCRALVEIGKGSTVLLHEATFDDQLRGDAKAKQHSTTSEAIGVGIAMGARRIILTHFSQRYQNIPHMDTLEGLGVEFDDNNNASMDDEGDMMGAADADGPLLSSSDQVPPNIGELVESGMDSDEVLLSGTAPVASGNGVARNGIRGRNARSSKTRDVKVGVAFDYMRVKVKDIMLLEKFTPALLKLYGQEYIDDDSALAEGIVPGGGDGTTGGEGLGRKNSAKGRGNGLERSNSGRGGGSGKKDAWKRRVEMERGVREGVRRGEGLFDGERQKGRKDVVTEGVQ